MSTGNIPAHAGKTLPPNIKVELEGEHPRARGENACGEVVGCNYGGTSPRTRGKPVPRGSAQ